MNSKQQIQGISRQINEIDYSVQTTSDELKRLNSLLNQFQNYSLKLSSENGSQSERSRPISKREENQVMEALMIGKGELKTENSPRGKK